MGGQIVFVSGEKMVCSSTGHSYICANFYCNKLITDYEIKRQVKDPSKRSRYNFCMQCRRKPYYDKVRCSSCNEGFVLQANNSFNRNFCDICKTIRRKVRFAKGNAKYKKELQRKRGMRLCRYCKEKPVGFNRSTFCSKECRNKDRYERTKAERIIKQECN